MENRNYLKPRNKIFSMADYNSLPKRNIPYGNNKREQEQKYYHKANPEEENKIGGLLPIRIAYNSLLGSFIKDYNFSQRKNYSRNYNQSYDSARGYGQNSRGYAGGLTYSSGKGVSALKGTGAKKAA